LKNCIIQIICLVLLSFFVLGLFTGCRHSPLLERTVYVKHAEEKESVDNKKLDKNEEKPDQNVADNQKTPVNKEGTGDFEFGADITGADGGLPQVISDSGIAVEVPESMDMVTTVSEATQNPHWKSSISYDSNQYTGERKDGIFAGQGTYTWDDGEKYTGEWKNGMYDGQGTYTWANGDQYTGGWKTETFEGYGTYTWASGSYYEGEWKVGVKEGQGTYTWANGDHYVGEWKAGVKEGQGTYTWADGSVYKGEWKYGVKEGQGTYQGADGSIFEGLWSNDNFVNL